MSSSSFLRVVSGLGFVVTGALVCAGCSSSSGSSSGDGGGGVSAEQACTDYANAMCQRRDSCSTGGYLNAINYGSEAACVSATTATCNANISAKGTGQTPTNLDACATQLPSEACADYLDNNPSGVCVPPAGAGDTGAPCGTASQCKSTFCATGANAVCGTCQPLPAAGALCQVNGDCGRDADCVKAAGSTTLTMGKCAPWVASGGACLTGITTCGSGLACVGDDPATTTMGKCQAQGSSVGAACDGSRKTAANCAGALGLVCIPTAKGSSVGTCKAIALADVGQACGDIGSAPITGYASCKAGDCIKASSTATMGTCSAFIAVGSACSTDPTTPSCVPQAKCVPSSQGGTTGTCTAATAATCG